MSSGFGSANKLALRRVFGPVSSFDFSPSDVKAPARPRILRTRPSRVVFVVNEDWFFLSHFRALGLAAQREGFSVSVACYAGEKSPELTALGFNVIPLMVPRNGVSLRTVFAAARQLAQSLPDAPNTIIHCIGAHGIVIGGIAARFAGIPNRVFAMTGRGFLATSSNLKSRITRHALDATLKHVIDTPQAHWLFENPSDAAGLDLDLSVSRVSLLGGAGVNPDHFPVRPLLPMWPLRLALVSRMVWSKGADIAVDAVRELRCRGEQVELHLYGKPDPANPLSFDQTTLRRWSNDGIFWHGQVRDITSVWAQSHACILPSRGGEGLPRSLLEAAASGRAILTTDVPGCRDFVRHGRDGLVVPKEDPRALAAAIEHLLTNPYLIASMGASARQRVLNGYTEQDVTRSVLGVYQRLLRGSAKSERQMA